jgi:hypothetical protein
MLEIGMITSRFQVDVLLKNFVNVAAGTLMFFASG